MKENQSPGLHENQPGSLVCGRKLLLGIALVTFHHLQVDSPQCARSRRAWSCLYVGFCLPALLGPRGVGLQLPPIRCSRWHLEWQVRLDGEGPAGQWATDSVSLFGSSGRDNLPASEGFPTPWYSLVVKCCDPLGTHAPFWTYLHQLGSQGGHSPFLTSCF